jgi:hypothetical protein
MAAHDAVALPAHSAPPRVQRNQQQQRPSLDLTIDYPTPASPSQLKKRPPSVYLAAQRLLQQALEQSDDNLRFAMLMQVGEALKGEWLTN